MTNDKETVAKIIADRVAKFPGGFANTILGFLGRERPELDRYYYDIDLKIEALLEERIKGLGYTNVTVRSLGERKNNSTGYPYAYILSAYDINPGWGDIYLPKVRTALQHATRATGVDLNYPLDAEIGLARLKTTNSMHVARKRNAAFMQD